MQPRRRTSRFDASTPAITPVPPTTTATTSEALKSDNGRLRGIIVAERKRHARIEAAFAKYLTALEQQVSNARSAYLEALTLRPTPGGRQ